MKPARSIPLILSVSLALFLIGGGLAVNVGAEENSYHQVVVFSEVLSLVLDNYVDPLEAQKLLHGAYEGMLAGLDAHGAYLTPQELEEWKAFEETGLADAGLAVLQAGPSLQVVAVAPGSSAGEAGIEPGDQIQSVDGHAVRELSLDQVWRLMRGAVGSTMHLDVLRASDGFRREEFELTRSTDRSRSYVLEVDRGIGILRVSDMERLATDELARELDDVSSRGVESLLIDLRNVADIDPRNVAPMGGLFASGALLRLKDRQGELVESIDSRSAETAWSGSIVVLVNGATAGAAEALASMVQGDLGGVVVGEPTYGLGSEAKLYEMPDGSALLISAAIWETASGDRWHGEGVEPDEVIRGKGDDYRARLASQLEQAVDYVARQNEPPVETEGS